MTVKDHISELTEKRQQVTDDLENLISAADYDPDGSTGTEFRELQSEAEKLDARIAQAQQVAELRAKGNAIIRSTGPGMAEPSEDIPAALIRSGAWQQYVRNGGSGRAKLLEIPMRRALITTATIPPNTQRIEAPSPSAVPTLLDVISRVAVSSGSVEVLQYPPFVTGAAEVAEGAVKPEGGFATTLTPHNLKTLAVWVETSRQVIEDETRLRDELSNGLIRGVMNAAANEAAGVINGGTGYNTANADTLMKALRIGIAEVNADGFSANSALLNPLDAADLDFYVWDNTGGTSSGVWGLSITVSPAIPAGTAYVGDFRTAFSHYYRGTADLYVTDSDVGTDGASNFKRNILTFLAEYRAVTAIIRADAVARVTVGTPPLPDAARARK